MVNETHLILFRGSQRDPCSRVPKSAFARFPQLCFSILTTFSPMLAAWHSAITAVINAAAPLGSSFHGVDDV